jgi:hypothetical protein
MRTSRFAEFTRALPAPRTTRYAAGRWPGSARPRPRVLSTSMDTVPPCSNLVCRNVSPLPRTGRRAVAMPRALSNSLCPTQFPLPGARRVRSNHPLAYFRLGAASSPVKRCTLAVATRRHVQFSLRGENVRLESNARRVGQRERRRLRPAVADDEAASGARSALDRTSLPPPLDGPRSLSFSIRPPGEGPSPPGRDAFNKWPVVR